MVDREVERWQERSQLLEKQYAELNKIKMVIISKIAKLEKQDLCMIVTYLDWKIVKGIQII